VNVHVRVGGRWESEAKLCGGTHDGGSVDAWRMWIGQCFWIVSDGGGGGGRRLTSFHETMILGFALFIDLVKINHLI